MSKEIEINEILAVLQSDLKKLIKHFRLDRRKQGEEDAPVIAENATPDNETLHRIEATLKELSERSTISDERLNKIINGAGEYLYQNLSNPASGTIIPTQWILRTARPP